MKRSAIEAAIDRARTAFAAAGLRLPPFADWGPEAWDAHGAGWLAQTGCGWDVTDYGGGDFSRLGLTLLTLRNGRVAELQAGGGRVYAEKALFCIKDQLSPMHRHMAKVEDIIVRGDGRLTLELWPDRDGRPDRSAVAEVMCDGVWRRAGADGRLILGPGESVTLTPDVWHAFWCADGDLVIGEVSSVNDDVTDNLFEAPVPRFPAIEPDAPVRTPLVCERLRAPA
jgi:D-lyxose ketol-isomerase